MGILILLVIPILAKASHGIAVLVGFVAGMIAGSVTFHFVFAKRGSNIVAWISGVVASAAIGAALGSAVGIGSDIGLILGAIGGAIGAVIGILH